MGGCCGAMKTGQKSLPENKHKNDTKHQDKEAEIKNNEAVEAKQNSSTVASEPPNKIENVANGGKQPEIVNIPVTVTSTVVAGSTEEEVATKIVTQAVEAAIAETKAAPVEPQVSQASGISDEEALNEWMKADTNNALVIDEPETAALSVQAESQPLAPVAVALDESQPQAPVAIAPEEALIEASAAPAESLPEVPAVVAPEAVDLLIASDVIPESITADQIKPAESSPAVPEEPVIEPAPLANEPEVIPAAPLVDEPVAEFTREEIRQEFVEEPLEQSNTTSVHAEPPALEEEKIVDHFDHPVVSTPVPEPIPEPLVEQPDVITHEEHTIVPSTEALPTEQPYEELHQQEKPFVEEVPTIQDSSPVEFDPLPPPPPQDLLEEPLASSPEFPEVPPPEETSDLMGDFEVVPPHAEEVQPETNPEVPVLESVVEQAKEQREEWWNEGAEPKPSEPSEILPAEPFIPEPLVNDSVPNDSVLPEVQNGSPQLNGETSPDHVQPEVHHNVTGKGDISAGLLVDPSVSIKSNGGEVPSLESGDLIENGTTESTTA